MRRAFVHIGTPRTGTTSLQHVLTRHRAALAEAGVLYPDLTPRSATEPHLSHQHLGEALAGRRPAREKRELLDRLDAVLAETACDVAVISYESLCLIPASYAAPETLRAALARRGFAMTVVMTVKPQIEQLNSIYTWRMQFLREARGFAAFARAFEGARELDYGALLAPWRAAAEGVIGVPVRDVADARPLLARVFAAMGLAERAAFAMGAEDAAVVENRSPGPVAVEVCRRLRAGGAATTLGARARATTREVERAAVAAGWDAASFVGPDAGARARVAARWRGANDRFAREVWGADWGEHVAEAPVRPVNEIFGSGAGGAAEDVVRGVLADVCAGAGIRLRGRVLARAMAAMGWGERGAARPGERMRETAGTGLSLGDDHLAEANAAATLRFRFGKRITSVSEEESRPTFFIPNVPLHEQEERYSELGRTVRRSAPALGRRIYSITYASENEVWTATVGKKLSGIATHVKRSRGGKVERTSPISNASTVIAIYPGVPYFVWHDRESRFFANPFMTGEPFMITYFTV